MAALSQKTVGKLIALLDEMLFKYRAWSWGDFRALLYENKFDVHTLNYLFQEYHGRPNLFLPLIYDGTIPAYLSRKEVWGQPIPNADDRRIGQAMLHTIIQAVLSKIEPFGKVVSGDELIASLREDGFDFIGGKIVPAGVKAVDLKREDEYLVALIRSIKPSNIDEIEHHHDESDKAFANRTWGSASSEARNFLIAVLRGLRDVATARGKIPQFNQPGKDGPLISDFQTIGLFNNQERDAVMHVWVLLGHAGPHVGIQEDDSARLSRLLAIGMTEWAVLKFIEWEKNGFKTF